MSDDQSRRIESLEQRDAQRSQEISAVRERVVATEIEIRSLSTRFDAHALQQRADVADIKESARVLNTKVDSLIRTRERLGGMTWLLSIVMGGIWAGLLSVGGAILGYLGKGGNGP